MENKEKRPCNSPTNCFFSCFIDDLTAINDGGEFEKALDEIYPPELELRRTYTSPFEALFLDLNIKSSNKKHT